jgi:hypothetical protein
MDVGFLFSFPEDPSSEDGNGGAEEPIKAGVAPTASLNGMRQSEEAEVLEKA